MKEVVERTSFIQWKIVWVKPNVQKLRMSDLWPFYHTTFENKTGDQKDIDIHNFKILHKQCIAPFIDISVSFIRYNLPFHFPGSSSIRFSGLI